MTFAAIDIAAQRLEEASGWCMRLAEGGLSADEQSQFDCWLAADAQNEEAFARVAATWNMVGQDAATAPEMIALRTQALEAFRAANSRRWAKRPKAMALRKIVGHVAQGANDRWPLKWAAGVAAVLLAVMVPAGVWYANLPTTYETGVGERQVAMLADGSRVSLDADSEVKVRLKDDARDIILTQGRAKFDVAKDALRPFRVHVGDKIVVATGTSFSVELLNDKAHVVLYEGHVAVVNANAAAVPQSQAHQRLAGEIDLNPGKELIASLSGTQQQIVPADLDRSLSWEAGQLSFSDEPLQSAVERVNRYSKKKVVIADASIRQLPVSGVYNAGDVDAFKVGIQAVMPVLAVDNGQAIELSRR
jgi:transmembrane sensor